MWLRLETRPEPSAAMRYASPLIALVLTAAVGTALFIFLGRNPLQAFEALFVLPVSTVAGLGELALKASPLMLIAMGLTVGFRASVWNIGAEGQLVAGAIAGGGLAVHFHGVQGGWLLPSMMLAGALGGALWAAVPAWLRTRFNANEILTSLMLTYVAQLALSYLVYGPWRDPDGFNFPQTRMFDGSALFSILIDGTRMNSSLFVALAAVALGWFFLGRSLLGYQMRVAGLSGAAASYAGISARKTVWVGMLAGGIAAGLAGVGEVAGPIGQLLPVVSPGYGFAAIIVAFVGRLHPVGIVLASLLMALLYLGGEAAQLNLNMPAAITGLFQGILLFILLGTDVLVNYRIRVVRRGARKSAGRQGVFA
ncbi:ABC transporter permease [Variovorax saccharolyticus]|uniref:ABC transporter permease n=1 Tax=Variovorax saccharolyticus TaxID=3053516 RepID=UPI002577C3E6|nr:ABC transporter permease [Variovorax sp. J22R187]MDM0022835.1 ABC transporter permease [Variovorax sp. J22R187]